MDLRTIRNNILKILLDQGKTRIEAELVLLEIDASFQRHLWINGKDFSKGTPDERLKFYMAYLGNEYDELVKSLKKD